MTEEVWAVWPTVHSELSRKMVKLWKKRGYKVAVLVNPPLNADKIGADKIIVQEEWKGFPTAANLLCHSVPGDVVAVVGDDVYPSEDYTAQELRERFLEQFPDRFGLAQPTGDDFASTDICAVSPWIGRAFIEEVYEGRGPFHEGYFHYYSDHELQVVAEKLEAFVQWKDVTQFHDHWQRKDEKRPQHLYQAERNWNLDQRLFKKREKGDFTDMSPARQSKRIEGQIQAWRDWRRQGLIKTDRESVSGLGSSLENTKEIREALPRFFKQRQIKTFTDVPCGDWHWMKEVDLSGVDYLGMDVVESQIRDNKKRFPEVWFQVANLVMDIPRTSDLILCRDFLFHLPNDMILKVLRNLKASRSKYLLTTSFPSLKKNVDLRQNASVGWRPVNLQIPPFSWNPLEWVQENDSDACRGRVVALFDLEAVA